MERKKLCYDGINVHDRYEVDAQGNVYRDGKIKAPSRMKRGYVYVSIRMDGKAREFRLHRIVLHTFKPNSNHTNLLGRHLNDIATDNRVDNLDWGDAQTNKKDFRRNRNNFKKALCLAHSLGLDTSVLSILSKKPESYIVNVVKKQSKVSYDHLIP
jgi:hypothetical protein